MFVSIFNNGKTTSNHENPFISEQDVPLILTWEYLYWEYLYVPGDAVVISEDEEYKKANFDKFLTLKAVFQKDGMNIHK